MGFLNKKPDPITERAQALKDEIAALEAQIKKLSQQDQQHPSAPTPKLRSTALPHGASAQLHAHTPTPTPSPAPAPTTKPSEPIFEEVNQKRLQSPKEPPAHFNDLGVRKYDFAALVDRMKNSFRGPSTANPKLVNYLAAGSIQGLRPMRYEKRVQRNRFIFIAA